MVVASQELQLFERVALRGSAPLDALAQGKCIGAPNSALEKCLKYLSSQDALDSINVDAYWPKWDGPWWQMVLLYEMGATELIPSVLIERIVQALNQDYLQFFPFTEDEVPPDRDPILHVACHCQLGTIYQLLSACGVDVDSVLPWIRPWFLRYQLPDGGLNCDEAAYTRAVPKSSVVSSLPPLESILLCTAGRSFTVQEENFLDRGAKYLLDRRLFRSQSSGSVIDESWLKLCFPRFYYYDVLRGLSFILRWSLRLKRKLPANSIVEALKSIEDACPNGIVRTQRLSWAAHTTRFFDQSASAWGRRPAESFELLDEVGALNKDSYYLTNIWNDCKQMLSSLMTQNLIEYSGEQK